MNFENEDRHRVWGQELGNTCVGQLSVTVTNKWHNQFTKEKGLPCLIFKSHQSL